MVNLEERNRGRHNVNEICCFDRSFTASLGELRLLFLPREGLLRLPLVYRFVYLRLPFTRLGGVNE
jgi:hypothetical protein